MTLKQIKLFTIVVVACIFTSSHIVAQSFNILGISSYGALDFGTIFQYKPNDTSLKNVVPFVGVPGGTPTRSLPVLYNNKLYGVCQEGGTDGLGIIYSYDLATGAYTMLHNFTKQTGNACTTPLVLASNNKLYGITGTESSGVHRGSIFEFDPATNVFVRKYNLKTTDGFNPAYSMVEHAGKLYALLANGGNNSITLSGGSIIEYTPGDTSITVKFKFTGTNTNTYFNGRNPQGNLLKVNNKFYGVTASGSVSNKGCIFEYIPGATSVTVRANFATTTFSNPQFTLQLANNGKLYGVTTTGGDSLDGVIFSFDTTTNALNKEFSFKTSTGKGVLAGLHKLANGLMIGTTAAGGANNSGVIYQFDPSTATYTVKHHFVEETGAGPFATVFTLPSGLLCGITNRGGSGGKGTLFEFNLATSTQNNLVVFSDAPNGATPIGRIIRTSTGRYFGMTQNGGSKNRGTIFEYLPASNTYVKRAEFLDTNGAYPQSTLMQAPNGKLYGTCKNGGTGPALGCNGGCGTLFEFDTTTYALVKKIDFGGINGEAPVGELVYLSGTTLLGVTGTSNGNTSTNYGGIIYQYNYSTNVITPRKDFTLTHGNYPFSGLTLHPNGLYYGVTLNGGHPSLLLGTIYEYNSSSNTITKRHEFDGVNSGSLTRGEMLLAQNGKFYGTTELGGANNLGVVFSFNPASNTFTKLADLTTSLGTNAVTKFVQYPDGKLYGLTNGGGAFGFGTLIRIDTATNTVTKVLDLVGAQARKPFSCGLTLLPVPCAQPATPTITASVNSVCNTTSSVTLTATGALNDATTFTWYRDSCTGTVVGTGNSITVTPTATTTYFARGTGGCVTNSLCGSKTISVLSPSATTTNITSCNDYTWTNGVTYTVSTVATQTLTNVAGCDSVATLNYIKLPSFNNTISDTGYLSLTLPWGVTVSASSTYTHMYSSVGGCDSLVTVNAYIHNGCLLQAKALLAGCYDVASALCRDSLRAKSLLPLSQPYGVAPYTTAFTHNGNEQVSSSVLATTGPNAIVDWVLLELRSAANPATIVETRSALLQRDGDIVDVDGVSAVQFTSKPNNYYVAVKHRNHQGVMLGSPIMLMSTVTNVNFTSNATSNYTLGANLDNGAYGAQTSLASKRALRAGNTSISGTLQRSTLTYNHKNFSDRHALLVGSNGVSNATYSVLDCDLDGTVKFAGLTPDRLVILSSLGNSHTLVLREQIP